MLGWLLMLVANVAACYQANPDRACTIRCNGDNACPSGLSCSSGFCIDHTVSDCDGDGGIVFDASDDGNDAQIDAPIDVASPCEGYTITIGASATRYRFSAALVTTWPAAAADCADAPGKTHLAVLGPTDAERSELSNAIGSNAAWLGLSDRRTQNTYLWVTSEDTMGYPNNLPWVNNMTGGTQSGDCVFARTTADLDTADCNLAMHSFVCECDAFADDPTRY